MKGMILAAGYGTRLKPLTDKTPKALIEYKSKPLILYQIQRLKNIGINDITVNTHHYAKMIKEYLDSISEKLGINFNITYEPEILGTGGGIINAGNFLKNSEYSVICNVDIYTDFNLIEIIDYHIKRNPLATILVQKRKTTKYILLDNFMKLISRGNTNLQGENHFAFNGIHIISKKFFELNLPIKCCDIIDVYLDLIKKGFEIIGFDAGGTKFKDLGKLENLRT